MISFVLGVVLLAAQMRGRVGSWATCWGAGTIALGLAGADQALRGLLPNPWLISSANVVAITGYVLIVQGARLLAGCKPRWTWMVAVTLLLLLPLALSHDPAHRPARVAYNNAILIACDLWVVVQALRLARHERLSTAWIMVGLFAITLPFSFLRLSVAMGAVLGTDTLEHARVNTWLAALLAAFWSLRGALPALLIVERSGRKLARLACHDALTGALNRAGFDELRPRLKTPTAVVMMDLDHFKAVNDRHGHAHGDTVLRLLAEAVGRHVRDLDALVRLGGDEFLLILPNATIETASQTAGSIQGDFAQTMRSLDIGDCRPTISIGIAAGDLRRINLDALLSDADKALYRSKEAGRDRISVQRLAA